MSEENICFVISPIGEIGSETRKQADQVLNHIIVPCAVECGFKSDNVIRADKISNPGAITHQIINYIIKADLVIADLSELNPNVFYELAIRHVLRKPYVQICDVNTKIPFDVHNQRTIIYDHRDLDSVKEAKELLVQYIQSALDSQENIMTPIHEGLVIEGLLESDKPTDRMLGELITTLSILSDKINNLEKTFFNGIGQSASNKGQAMPNKSSNYIGGRLLNTLNMTTEKIDLLKTMEIGQKVNHKKWGEGEIVDIKGDLPNTEVTVKFLEPIGIRKLMAVYAPLEIIK